MDGRMVEGAAQGGVQAENLVHEGFLSHGAQVDAVDDARYSPLHSPRETERVWSCSSESRSFKNHPSLIARSMRREKERT